MTTLNISVPRQAQEPRGARFAASVAAALMKWISKRNDVRATPSARGDSIQLRTIARSFERTDPRLAAELYAVADRSEAR